MTTLGKFLKQLEGSLLSCGVNGGCEDWYLQTVPKVAKYSVKKQYLEKKVMSTYNKVLFSTLFYIPLTSI